MRIRINIVQFGVTGCLASIALAAYLDNWFFMWCANVALIGFGIGLLWKRGD